MRSQAVTLLPEYPLLFSVATPADKHLAGHPGGHTPPHSQIHTYTDTGIRMRAQLLHPPPGSSNYSSWFLALATKAAAKLLMSVL